MTRITKRDLEAVIARLNNITGSPTEPWTRTESGELRANVGNYHLSGAYGGWCVHRMANEHGGVSTPVAHGHIPARELYERLHAYLRGYEAGRNA